MSETVSCKGVVTEGNVDVGGKLTVQGATTLEGNVTIGGWLVAPNIVGMCKGLFASVEALESAYPKPTAGSFALVGETLPAAVYMVANKQWYATGEEGGDFTITMESYEAMVTELTSAVENMSSEIAELEEGVNALEASVEVMQATLTTTSTTASAAKTQAESNESKIAELEEAMESQTNGNTVNVNAECDDIEYSLSEAIGAVLAKETASSKQLIRKGTVLTFRSDEMESDGVYKWKSYQFTREMEDLSVDATDAWTEYGAGSSSSSDLESDVEGLQNLAIVDFEESSDEDYRYYKAVNSKGEECEWATTIKVPLSGGSGSSSDSTLTIYFEDSAPTRAYGGDIVVYAALRSVSYPEGSEVLGVIKNITVIDASTGLTLSSEDMNVVSSSSSTDYKFEIDLTAYFSAAASKTFTIQVTDDDGNVKKKSITVVAVDVTVTQPMALNYSTSTALTVGGSTKTIGQFYRFPNNASTIVCTVEIYWNGAWKTLGTSSVADSYTRSISVNPSNVFGGGEQMSHGGYPVRVYGMESKSGVTGNVIYSTLMCVDSEKSTPIVALRWNDTNEGKVKLYESIEVEVAAYTPGKTETSVSLYIDGEAVTTANVGIAETLTVSKQVQGYSTDETVTISVYAQSGSAMSYELELLVSGTTIAAVLKEGESFVYDFSTRSNSESDHTISNNGVTMSVTGANWSSNGFVDYLGERALRIAENVTAEIVGYKPFGTSAVETTTGMALQIAFATKNIKDSEAKLIACYDEDSGAGFYVCGNKVAIYVKSGQPALVERSFRCGEKVTIAVVVEPSTIYVTRGGSNYSCMKLYVNGEEIGCIGYIGTGSAILNTKTVTMDGTDGDLYLYYVLAYEDYYEWAQAFPNYLCKLTDSAAMVEEYEAEDVLNSQNVPTMEALAAKEIPYYVIVANQSTFDSFDGDIDTSTKFSCTLFYYHPTMPWRSFKATNVQWRRQGTTSAKRPIKNDRFYLQKNTGWSVTPIYEGYEDDDAVIAYALMEKGYVRVGENSMPVKVITCKVDYSDSSNANDCGVCDLMNATFRALGDDYMTPAQRAFDGTWSKGSLTLSGLELNHSTANHPVAVFRSTLESLTDAWFHAKGNWKEDKGEQVALGFKDTPGYNYGCVNYGEFVEYFGTEGETLDEIETRFKKESGLDTTQLYLLSQYCGADYRFMAYSDGAWSAQSGEMKQEDGVWTITGTVLNPVSGYELLTYDGLDWWQGVGSVEDMMEPTTAEASWVTKLSLGQESYPMWTRYFECMIDDDQLQIDLAMGRKVPYELYKVLEFCNSCDYSREDLDDWATTWKEGMWKLINPYSLVSYYLFTDYLAAVDQQAKNMQPMFFMEPGASVKDGVYTGVNGMEARRMYLNKVYDCDTCNGKDNDGGQTIDAETDPADTTSTAYAGRGSVLWNNIRGQQTMDVDQSGNTLTLRGVADTMRSLPDTLGIGAGPFSPEGAEYYFVTQRMKKWPKVVSTYDGERKYVKYEGYSDLYFYALQGLGLTSLPAFIEARWRQRDGYYRCGDFKSESGYIGGRIGAKEGAVIRFRAAKSGYFGVGNDSGNVTEWAYVEAGEEYAFSEWQHGTNIMLYIYQADRMSMIDLSEVSIDPQFGNTLSKMTLLEELYVGGEEHSDWTYTPGNTGYMTNLDLGEMPFIRVLDIRNTEVTEVTASTCPRLETVYADGTSLTSITIAETSPIEVLTLPETITSLVLNNLPKLSYPGGLVLGGVGKLKKLFLNNCPEVSTSALLLAISEASALQTVRITDVNVTAAASMLQAIMDSGAIGLDSSGNAYEEENQCSGITGRWIMSDLIADNELALLAQYFPQLSVYNAPYTVISHDDTMSDSVNVTNHSNGTGALYDTTFKASGHFAKYREMIIPVYGILDAASGTMLCTKLSTTDSTLDANGATWDYTDSMGEGKDAYKYFPKCWFKGINDYKNQRKYTYFNSGEEEPVSTATVTNRYELSDCLYVSGKAAQSNGTATNVSSCLVTHSSYSTYRVPVDGMAQLRYPGVNSGSYGVVFTDDDGEVVGTFAMAVSTTTYADFDFSEGAAGAYVIADVPTGATWAYFSAPASSEETAIVTSDSSELEAMEPDWVESPAFLLGKYQITVDSSSMVRSLSGSTTKRGSGTSTSASWVYDDDGNPTGYVTVSNYTMMDFKNLSRLRGEGYQLIDYRMHSLIALLAHGLYGTRDIQAVLGYGKSSGGTTGYLDSYGDTDSTHLVGASNGCMFLGLESIYGCNTEYMDYVLVNVENVAKSYAAKLVQRSGDEVDKVWHIYDPQTQTERTVASGGGSTSGPEIRRVAHGRYCDMVPVGTITNSSYNTYYGDAYYYTASTCRVVLRSRNNASANAGLAFANADNASSYSHSGIGSRLAFRGAIEIVE